MLGIWWPPSDLTDLQSFHFIWQDTTLQKHIPKFSHKKNTTAEKEKKNSANSKKTAANFVSRSYEVNQEQAEGVRNGTVNRGKGLGSAVDGGKNLVTVFFGLLKVEKEIILH